MMNLSQKGAADSELLQARRLIGTLQEELAETNRGLVALTIELDERTRELRLAQEELRRTNSELRQLTLQMEDRVNERTRELQAKSAEVRVMSQQLWQAAKLATMGELAANIAHELNNPLATLALRSEWLLGHLDQKDSNRHSIEVMSKEVDRMASLVRNLLQFSRRNQPRISGVDVCKEINNSLELIQYLLRGRNIKIVTDYPQELPVIQADRQQLQQLFLNLLVNAGDAMLQGGKLTAQVSSGSLPEDVDAVIVRIIDTGTGIPPEHLENVWDAFFTTKAEGKGTGLGLAICRRVTEEHQGTITIDSKTGVGTTVSIALPVMQQRADSLTKG